MCRFSNEVKTKLRETQHSQKWLAQQLRVKSPTLNYWLGGKVKMPTNMLCKCLGILDYEIDYKKEKSNV